MSLRGKEDKMSKVIKVKAGGYTLEYDGSRSARLTEALRDALDYLPANIRTRLFAVLRDIKACPSRPRTKRVAAYMACEFAGLRGLPATAVIKEAWRNATVEG